MLALNFPSAVLEGKETNLRDAWSQKVVFYNMSFFFFSGLSSADAKSICTLPGEFCFTGQVRKMQKGGGLFCVSPALDVSREGVDRAFLSPPLSFSVSITMELRRGNHTASGSMHELRVLKQKAHHLSPARSFREPALPLQ